MAEELYPWERQELEKKRGLGCAIAGWAAFFVAFAVIAFLGYRVWFYYDKIRSGDLIDLPQFSDRFTQRTRAGASVFSRTEVDRAEVETADNPTLGSEAAEAELTIVEFADFECPYSKQEAPVVRRLMARYGGRVRFVYRDFPIQEVHTSAVQAAVAAECAREQGKFWAYHDKLYVNSPSLGFQDLLRYAEEAGMDTRQFERCLVDERYKEKVTEDMRTAETLGLRGTPTFFLDGQKIEGAIPPDVFEGLIEKLLQ